MGCSGPFFFGCQAHQHSSGPTEQGTAPQPRDLLPSPGKHGGGECLLLQGPPAREELQPAHSVPRVLGNGHNGRAGQSRSKGSVKNLSCPAVPDGATSPGGGGWGVRGGLRSSQEAVSREIPREPTAPCREIWEGSPEEGQGKHQCTLAEDRTVFAWPVQCPPSDGLRGKGTGGQQNMGGQRTVQPNRKMASQ